jgi:hypothetical protein
VARCAVYKYCPAPIYILYYLGQSWTMIKVGVATQQLLILNKRFRYKLNLYKVIQSYSKIPMHRFCKFAFPPTTMDVSGLANQGCSPNELLFLIKRTALYIFGVWFKVMNRRRMLRAPFTSRSIMT